MEGCKRKPTKARRRRQRRRLATILREYQLRNQKCGKGKRKPLHSAFPTFYASQTFGKILTCAKFVVYMRKKKKTTNSHTDS